MDTVEHAQKFQTGPLPIFFLFCAFVMPITKQNIYILRTQSKKEYVLKLADVVFNAPARTSSKFYYWRGYMIYLDPKEFVALM